MKLHNMTTVCFVFVLASMTAVTNDYNLRGLKQYKCIILTLSIMIMTDQGVMIL